MNDKTTEELLCIYAATTEKLNARHSEIIGGFLKVFKLRKTDITRSFINVFMDKMADLDETLTDIYSKNAKITPRPWHAEYLKLMFTLRVDKIKALKPLEDAIFPKLPKECISAWNDGSLVEGVHNIMKAFGAFRTSETLDEVCDGKINAALTSTVSAFVTNLASFYEAGDILTASEVEEVSTVVEEFKNSTTVEKTVEGMHHVLNYCKLRGLSLELVLPHIKGSTIYTALVDISNTIKNPYVRYSVQYSESNINTILLRL